jgi:hypothetical protein
MSELATMIAAQCWCDPRTSDREMDGALAAVFAEVVDRWIETARQCCGNEEYYRGLLDQIGAILGPEAYRSDDGSVQDEVVRAALPDLVKARLAKMSDPNITALRAAEERWEALRHDTRCHDNVRFIMAELEARRGQ